MRIGIVLATAGLVLCLSLAGCSGAPPRSAASESAREVVLMALGLLDTGYRYGGRNPEAGLDCSGMVSHVFAQAAGIKLGGSAAEIARRGRMVQRDEIRPGDLVFFNTRGFAYSHVGIYLGEGRFIHAPSSQGLVRTEKLDQGWFANRWHDTRRYLD